MACKNISLRLLRSDHTGCLISKQQIRQLSIHEYQSQDLLKQFGVPVPRGKVAQSPDEVRAIIEELGGRCVVKSQILRGGRGKGTFDSGLQGGIQMVESPEAGKEIASKMLGHRLKTKQTPSKGLKVDKLYVVETIKYHDEWYLAMTIDREQYKPAIIISKSGGVDIETMAKESPEKLLTFHFNLTQGITAELISEISRALRTSVAETKNLEQILSRMHSLFVSKDATLLEINPLVRSSDSTFTCLDAKFSFDNAAEKRQQDLFALRDVEHEVSEELEAEKYGLVYVRMDGNIGNVVNGAGLAMATNDAIAHSGGASANFLDAGGQATKETMMKAFEIILRDERVKTILVNIYGGITRCDMIAESIIGAAKELGSLRVPVVVRLQGTNSEEGLKLVEKANLGLHTESGFGDAAKKAVELAKSA
ncbi:succinate-CoA ligase [Rhizodiscina lignyota]|uniref:Succinate--CoA ligase [ADP-forming] subunit beta, mitochondrial n=1 Tax=Rhizodiscina lignyota TaxID=1504668 RepID=A0A9P4M082_9PEZI|nr:succinate-CoA ligase [Rhizodiscina lignyota]